MKIDRAPARLLGAFPPLVAAKRNSDGENPLPADKKMSGTGV
jgi:hypothetical protein